MDPSSRKTDSPDDVKILVDDPESTPPPPVPQKKSFFGRRKKPDMDEKPDESKEPEAPKVSFFELFKYTTRHERAFMSIACISAAAHGALLPMFTIIFGGVVDELATTDNIRDRIGGQAKWFLILAGAAFVLSLIQVRLQLVVAQRTCARIRRMFFESIMSQDFTWYDASDGGELTTRVANDVNIIQAGIGDKVTSVVQFTAMFFTGIIIAFVKGPLLTLVVLSLSPLLVLGGAVFGKFAAASTGDGLGAYGSAGAIASEVIGLIRVVTAYNGQQAEVKRYEAEVQKAYKSNVSRALLGGFFLGFTMLVIFCSYALAFYFGATRILYTDSLTAGNIVTAFFAVIISCVSIGQAAPSFQSFASAQGAAPRVFEVIERTSEINPLKDNEGEVIPDFKGHVAFSDVYFRYKKLNDESASSDEEERPYVLENFSMMAPPGTSHALVGPSGCGKSTTVRLVERFYDIEKGSLTLDGVNIRSLNVRWLRSQIGYVGQMPTLFMMTIRENISLGAPMEITTDEKTGLRTFKRKTLTNDEIEEAAKMANAHDFIMKLPERYDTMLGERGALLSGGQKQRICIARALVRNPRILILDESTAALDSVSEKVVQLALEKAATGRTTITIAHRLSTVRDADVISVLDHGKVVESGKHNELMAMENGAYRTLVENQNIKALKGEGMDKSAQAGEPVGEADVMKSSLTKTKQDSATTGKGDKEESDEDKTESPDIDPGVFKRVYAYNMPEVPYMIIGMIGAAAAGASFPISALVFSDAIYELLQDNVSLSQVRTYVYYYLAIGAGALVGNLLQVSMVSLSGERLTRKLRNESFKAIMRQEMGFFDEKENSLGALTTRLATDASTVQGVAGGTMGAMGFVSGTIATGFLVSYISCWQAALVVTAVFPLMAFAGALQMKMMTGFDSDSDKRYMSAGAVASEAVDNLETVTAIGVQDVFMDKYNHELDTPLRNGQRTALIAGVAFGISEFMSFALWAIAFWIGSIFVENAACQVPGLFKAITGLLFAGMMLGQVSMLMPDIAKSRIAATRIFRLLDRESKIDPTHEDGSRDAIVGDVAIKDVEFEYPTRPDVPVLRKLTAKVAHGKRLALVGASGCGKSTVIALLERFYDPRNGEINVDDNLPLNEYNVRHVRSHIGLVSQEPDLFNRSVRDNIAYGLGQENGTVVTDSMIENAAKAANAHDFIVALPEGYDTVVGPRGNKLSGGQRQRVAIARAIVREPRLLLLDEATSALDGQSEKLVQEALDRVGEGRTTVAIAHRLSTVKDADAIAVVARGKIVELGTHEQLLRVEGGEYATLVKNQLAGNDDGE